MNTFPARGPTLLSPRCLPHTGFGSSSTVRRCAPAHFWSGTAACRMALRPTAPLAAALVFLCSSGALPTWSAAQRGRGRGPSRCGGAAVAHAAAAAVPPSRPAAAVAAVAPVADGSLLARDLLAHRYSGSSCAMASNTSSPQPASTSSACATVRMRWHFFRSTCRAAPLLRYPRPLRRVLLRLCRQPLCSPLRRRASARAHRTGSAPAAAATAASPGDTFLR